MAERLGQYLLRKGAISEAQLQEALRTQQFFGGNLGSHLIQLGYLEEDELGEALAELLGVPYAGREVLRRPEPLAVAALPADFTKKHRALPFRLEKNELHLALQNPRDALGLHEASFLTGLQIVPYVSPEFRLLQAIEKHYRVRLDRRQGIRVPGGIPVSSPPKKGAKPAPPRKPPAPEGPELGLDGRPLDAPAEPVDFQSPATPGLPGATSSAGEGPPKVRVLVEREAPGADPREAPASPEPPAAVRDLEQAARGIVEARDRDAVARVALGWLSARYRRAALLSVQRDLAVGWTGTGPDFEPERIKRVQVDLKAPSIFSTFRDVRSIYFGPVPSVPANQDLFTYLGGRLPTAALVVPVAIKSRLVALLYADNGDEAMPPPDLVSVRRLAAKVALGLEVLILRNKVLMA